MDSDYKIAFAFAGSIILIFLIWITAVRWHDIKGIVFVNQESLQQTSGTIVSSKVVKRNSHKNGCSFHYAISYEYNIDGKIYNSNAITFSYTGTKDGKMAQDYVQKYPVGKVITVFYIVNDPSFSVLEPEIKDQSLIVVIIGLFIFPIIICWVLVSLIKENMYFG